MKNRLLIVSHVLPYPGSAGQQLRIRYMLQAAAELFEVDFLTCACRGAAQDVKSNLTKEPCRSIIIESNHDDNQVLQGLMHKAACAWFMARTGLKASNYRVGVLDLNPDRVSAAVDPAAYDCAIYEYFHAVDSAEVFRREGVPVVLDMHNVLWQALEQRLGERKGLYAAFKQTRVERYRRREEAAWSRFDALVAINREEYEAVRHQAQRHQRLFFCPMGTDLAVWAGPRQTVNPPRVAYYGGLGSAHNQASALRCHNQIMPLVWKQFTSAELWLIGSNPPDRIRQLTANPRVKVTGFVENISECFRSISLMQCPWSGTYGFRSRVVEAMSAGVPVIATPEAVAGMDLEPGKGIFFESDDKGFANRAIQLLANPALLEEASRLARSEMERLYSLDNTYRRFMRELQDWLGERKHTRSNKQEAHVS